MVLGDSLWRMVLGVWFWVYGFGRMVRLWAYGLALGVWFGFGPMAFGTMVLGAWFLEYGFGRMVLGAWFLAYVFGRMVRLWAYGFGRMVIGVWFWAYGFGRIVWTHDLGAQPCKRGQAKLKSIYAY